MALTRRMLKELGLEEESIEKIMSEHGKVMEGMTTKAQAEEEKKKALEDFQKDWEAKHKPVEPKDSEAYKELEKKYTDLQFDINLSKAKVKDKYRDFVRAKIDSTKPFEEAIKDVQKDYAEFFDSETEPARKPALGGGDPPAGGETEADKIKKDFLSAFKR